MDVGDGIRELRENAGMTQAELGKVAGVSSNAVSQWENKRAVPRMGAIQRIADYFGIPKSIIMGDSMAVMDDATPEERALLMFFRSCSPRGKSNILEYSEDMARRHPKINSDGAGARTA